jgi:hypothetical protein
VIALATGPTFFAITPKPALKYFVTVPLPSFS